MSLDLPSKPAHTAQAMSDDQFTKLFTYMLQGFAEMRHEMHEGFEKNTREHDRIYGVIDATLKRLETLEQEGLY